MKAEWTFRSLDHRPESFLARSVIYPPILKRVWKGHTIESLNDAHRRVRAIWRRRLNQLRHVGSKAVSADRIGYMINCPPTGSAYVEKENRTTHFCNVSRLCPWCWFRVTVRPLYRAVVAGLSAHDMGYHPSREKYPSLLATGSFVRHIPREHQTAAQVIALVARDLKADGSFLTAMGATGTAQLATIEPGVIQRYPVWHARVAFVVLWPRAFGSPDVLLKRKVSVTSVPHPFEVARAVAAVGRFPAGVLAGDPAAARDLVDDRSRTHLLRTRGVFRTAPAPASPEADDSGGAATAEDAATPEAPADADRYLDLFDTPQE